MAMQFVRQFPAASQKEAGAQQSDGADFSALRVTT
jgi:hypothetical protein